jgi:hypothetical protein
MLRYSTQTLSLILVRWYCGSHRMSGRMSISIIYKSEVLKREFRRER